MIVKNVIKTAVSLTVGLLVATAPVFGKTISIPDSNSFPEGVTVTSDGTFFMGSLKEGAIARSLPGSDTAEIFVKAGAHGLVSVVGVYAEESSNTLWACNADVGHLGYGVATRMGEGKPSIKAFDLTSGSFKGSYDLPDGGFCNDLTADASGNLYASDSWSPRILILPKGDTKLSIFAEDDRLGTEIWQLNGLDVDRKNNILYVLNQAKAQLWAIPINADHTSGLAKLVSLDKALSKPDGLRLIAPDTLGVVEGGRGGMSVIKMDRANWGGTVTHVSDGLNGPATFAYHNGSAWVAETQGGSFWCAPDSCSDPVAPFRLVEVPLNLK